MFCQSGMNQCVCGRFHVVRSGGREGGKEEEQQIEQIMFQLLLEVFTRLHFISIHKTPVFSMFKCSNLSVLLLRN